MSFRDNLQHLRATRHMTQEQLAMMVGVSRQAVTKWEAERAYPEMDKLVKICQIFDCSIDELVEGDLTARPNDPAQSVPNAAAQDTIGYEDHMRSRARRMGVSIGLFVAGCGLGFAAEAIASLALGNPSIVYNGIGIAAVTLACVAIGLIILIPTTTEHNSFMREHPYLIDFYSAKDRAANEKTRARNLAIGIAVIFLGVISAIAAGCFVDDSAASEGSMAVTMLLIGTGVGLVVRAASLWDMTDIDAYNMEALCSLGDKDFESAVQELEPSERRRAETKRWASHATGTVCGALMIVATMVALASLWVTGWEFFWVFWPIGGIGCGLASVVIGAVADRRAQAA